MNIVLVHSCLNCEEPISDSTKANYKDSLGYMLCSVKCMKELNEEYHKFYPKHPDPYDVEDVFKG